MTVAAADTRAGVCRGAKGERRPYPLEALAGRLGAAGGPTALASQLDVSVRNIYRWRRIGLTEAQADEFAVRCGLHPCEVWDWW